MLAKGEVYDKPLFEVGEVRERTIAPLGAGIVPLALGVDWGRTVRAAIAWRNIGTTSYAFDLGIFYGNYDSATKTFTIIVGRVVENITLAGGASTTTNIDYVHNQPITELFGVRDALALVGDYNATTGAFTSHDAYLVEDAVEFKAPAYMGDITGVTFSVV
jgi:hypothetical protein